MCGQSTVYNTYATLLPPNPLFQGFSRSQNVNKERFFFCLNQVHQHIRWQLQIHQSVQDRRYLRNDVVHL